jgi:putative sterol carrier protein
MTTASHEFFEQLDDRGYEPLLAKTTGTLCVELVHGEQSDKYYITISKGAVSVSREDADVHCHVCCPMALFEQVVQGEVNAMAAVLRGDMTVDGDPGILLLFQRLLPGPPNSSHPRARAATER